MATNLTTDMVLVQVEQSIWTGKAKLSREDIPDADKLPPDVLVSLGSKRIFDPDKLKPFYALRQETNRLMWGYGAKFLSGWAVQATGLHKLDAELFGLKNKFNIMYNDFISSYATSIDDWCKQNAPWEHILRKAIPSLPDVSKRFSYNWYMYEINIPESQLSGMSSAKSLVSAVPEQTLEEVTALLASSKTKSSLKKSGEKLRNMSFTNPQFVSLADLLDTLADDKFHQHRDALLAALSDKAVLDSVLASFPKRVIPSDDLLSACLGGVAQQQGQCSGSVELPTQPQPVELSQEEPQEPQEPQEAANEEVQGGMFEVPKVESGMLEVPGYIADFDSVIAEVDNLVFNSNGVLTGDDLTALHSPQPVASVEKEESKKPETSDVDPEVSALMDSMGLW